MEALTRAEEGGHALVCWGRQVCSGLMSWELGVRDLGVKVRVEGFSRVVFALHTPGRLVYVRFIEGLMRGVGKR